MNNYSGFTHEQLVNMIVGLQKQLRTQQYLVELLVKERLDA